MLCAGIGTDDELCYADEEAISRQMAVRLAGFDAVPDWV